MEIFTARYNAHMMEVLVENLVAGYYLGDPEVQLAIGLFQLRSQVAY